MISENQPHRGRLFLVALVALFAVGYAAASRAAIATDLKTALFDPFQPDGSAALIGSVLGATFAGFALTLLVVSPLLDAIGMRRALLAAAAALIGGLGLIVAADSLGSGAIVYSWVWAGMVLQGVAWGLTEATINPLTTTLYPDERTHRLNVLHAWWPAGLIVGGLTAIGFAALDIGWRWTLAGVLIPAITFAILAWREDFPPTERKAAGIPISEMWQELLRRPAIFLWIGLMMMTAATELAPGQWVDLTLSKTVGMRGILLLVYVAGLMFVMRHFAGPLVHHLSNTGLLTMSSIFAAIGLYGMSVANDPIGALIAATLWGMGVCFMWPTMLATAAERFPRGGSLVIGLVGAAGAGSTWLVLPYLGLVYDRAKLEAAGGKEALDMLSGPALDAVSATAATASFQAVAIIPVALAVVFGVMRIMEGNSVKAPATDKDEIKGTAP